MRILITCPPMLAATDPWRDRLAGHTLIEARGAQQLQVGELQKLVVGCDGVIAGDDPFTEEVLMAGLPTLRAIAKWGIGLDAIDLAAAARHGIRVSNTPQAFGDEVADVAIGYLVMLTRHLHRIDAQVRQGHWYKPQGVSLRGKTAGIVGLGDIGRAIAGACGGWGCGWWPPIPVRPRRNFCGKPAWKWCPWPPCGPKLRF
ncbi:MAG: hypothetical protein HC918_07875 [Oscillatoriales cyanobacterium SM2_1_8]|nr:hypothetical protein [Oscillatoriales cyanobacterium SM2_1_8]